MKAGKISQTSSGTSVEVDYTLSVWGLDDAGGRIVIEGDPSPGARFMGNPASVFPGDLNYVLETESGALVSVFFKNSNGDFVCQMADEARSALAAGG